MSDILLDIPQIKTIHSISESDLDYKTNLFIKSLEEAIDDDLIVNYVFNFHTTIGNLYCFITYWISEKEDDEYDI